MADSAVLEIEKLARSRGYKLEVDEGGFFVVRNRFRPVYSSRRLVDIERWLNRIERIIRTA